MLLEGQQIGRYRFLRLLGSGGMGNVYLAEDDRIEQQVAVKVIRGEGTLYPDAITSQDGVRLFRREAKAIARLDHPNILPLFDYGEESIGDTTIIYLVMPYRQEGSLASWLRQRHTTELLSLHEVDHIIGQAAASLQHAHYRQIVHQDVKPSNFLLRQREEGSIHPDVLLADFGIARFMTAVSSTSQSIRGTPTYMAPEQWKGEPVSATDQYALAVMTYELLTGRPPFQGNPGQVMYQHMSVEPSPPSAINPRLSHEIDGVLLQALAKNPEQRFDAISAFANAFHEAIQHIQDDHDSKLAVPLEITIRKDENGAVDVTDAIEETTPVDDSSTVERTLPVESDAFTKTEPAPIKYTTPLPAVVSAELPAIKQNASPEEGRESITFHRRPGRQLRAVAGLVALIALLIFGSIAYAAHGMFSIPPEKIGSTFPTATVGSHPEPSATVESHPTSPATAGPRPASSAILTILPASTQLAKLYTLLAVVGSPDASQHQVSARILSYTTQTQTQTVNATGQGTIPGTQASGTVLVDNFNTAASLTLNAGSVYTNTYGASTHMVLDATITVPPAPSSTTWSQGSTTGHILEVGTIGNNEFNNNISGSITYSVFNNPPFSNGKDAQTYTVVQQSDINNAANALINANTPDAQQVLQSQIQANERMVGTPQCTSHVTSNHAAGDKATSVTVGVNFTCTGEVYDASGARTMAAGMLNSDAQSSPGSGYVLAGNVTTSVTGASITDTGNGTVTVTVSASGEWVYQFSDAQKQAMASMVVSKHKNDAQNLLLKQTGVKQVDIQMTGGDGSMLPVNASEIVITVESVAGIQ